MNKKKFKVLLACYGGGHVQSLIPVASALATDSRFELTVIGFTTARAAFERAGITVSGYTVLEKYIDESICEGVNEYIEKVSHPDITLDETIAYFRVGIHDLILEYGRNNALKMIGESGRSEFMPVSTFTSYLKELNPDLVVTSTSPRSELALQRAAKSMGITGLAISDLFLQHEAKYLCDDSYAPHITVIAEYVEKFLRSSGCCKSSIHVTGNPAFDSIFTKESKENGYKLRNKINLNSSDKLITWIGTPAIVSLVGKKFIENKKIIDYLESFCERNVGYRFAFRPHPNLPVDLPDDLKHGVLLGKNFTIESVLWASDMVVLETSTVGMQAALIGKPVVTIAADDYPPYAQLNLATDISSLSYLDVALNEMVLPDLNKLGPAGLGDACQRVIETIENILLEDN